jgi:succinoglycan biosynthesis transport protein ExoP
MRNLSLPSARSGALLPIEPAPVQYLDYDYTRPAPSSPFAYWEILRRHKWTIVRWALIGIALGVLATFLEPHLYEAKATLEVQDLNDNFLNMKQVLPVNEVGLSGTFNDMQTQLKIIESDSVVNPVIERMPARAAQLSLTSESTLERLRRLLRLSSGPPSFTLDDSKKLADTMKVRAVGQTRVLEITADSSNPQLAAEFINQICTEYIDQNMRARWEMSQRTGQSLAKLVEEAKEKVRTSEDALQEYARTSGLMITSDKKNVADEKLSQIQDELSKAQADRISAQARYEMAKKSLPHGLPDELSQGLLREYQSKLTQLQQQRAELAATYTGDYGKIKRLDSEISSLQAAIHAEEQSVVERTENQFHAATTREKLLASSFASQSGVVIDLGQRSVQYNILQHEVDSNQQAYDEMLKQVKEASVASAVGTTNVRIVDSATPPKLPYSPKPLLSCALGMAICSLWGVLLGVARDGSDRSLREPGEGNQYLGLTEMGVMIRDASGTGLLHSPGHPVPGLLSQTPGLGTLQWGRSQSGGVPHLSDWFANPGKERLLALESCRAVVTSLLAGSNAGVPQLLVVTSPGPGEGKTTVVANLGLTLALLGRRVLLVDGDIRRSRLHKYFDLENERGLTTLLEKGQDAGQLLDSCVQKTVVPGLSVLGSGPVAALSTGLLYSPHLATILARLRGEYDFVLVDSPPMFPAADARVLGILADGVILVARAGSTAREAAGTAHRRLAADGVRVLGLVLNDWDPRSSAHTYYAEYSKEYTNNYSD